MDEPQSPPTTPEPSDWQPNRGLQFGGVAIILSGIVLGPGVGCCVITNTPLRHESFINAGEGPPLGLAFFVCMGIWAAITLSGFLIGSRALRVAGRKPSSVE